MKTAHIKPITLATSDFSELFHNFGGRNFLDKAAVTIVKDAIPVISVMMVVEFFLVQMNFRDFYITTF